MDTNTNENSQPADKWNNPEGPVSNLVKALLTDNGYRQTWKANLAMAYYDEAIKRDRGIPLAEKDRELFLSIANEAAENFLNLLTQQ